MAKGPPKTVAINHDDYRAWHHVKFGIAGGYVLGVTLAAARCLFG